jgi:hypothetical protein
MWMMLVWAYAELSDFLSKSFLLIASAVLHCNFLFTVSNYLAVPIYHMSDNN